MHLRYPEIQALRLAQQARLLNISQTEIARATGVTQSQISRIFDGKIKRSSRALDKISNYLDLQPAEVSLDDVRKNEELMQALVSTWDGTDSHSKALATIIKSLRVLTHES